ncbi:exodeoxyribonuclease V subunit gamma, partial [Cellulomonas massiliensis]|uniref:exodeoxyribonuclease V subunit gamma n=1 Tax=Cellulomonas massiliensis TaxID=1465811 RepID=UPI0009DA5B51
MPPPTTPPRRGLHAHVSERTDVLVDGLAELLLDPPADPFAPEVVAVPTRGVERWVAQRLAHRLGAGPTGDGVCAHVRFDPPGRVVAQAVAAVLGVRPEDDPWHPARLVWDVVDVVDASLGEAWAAPLARYLGAGADEDDPRRSRRVRTAQHVARLFASYAAQRPQMVLGWAEGRDDDGAGAPLRPGAAWQPHLWRRLRAHLGAPSPAERLDDAVALLRDEPAAVDLPARLSVLGPTRLSGDQLTVLAALGEHRAVHLWLPHPSAELWGRVEAALPTLPLRRARLGVPGRHPLLTSMARDATELQVRVAHLGARTTWLPAPRPPASTLGHLQARVRDDDASSAPAVLDDAAGDRSVQVHACYGRARQVEVLREVVVGLLADDPTLEPRDVVVMCPDVEAFAPLVAATFGVEEDERPGAHPGRTLRVRVADRSLRQTNPLLTLLSDVLELAGSRVGASQVVDLLASPPVRQRFVLTDEDVERVTAWVQEAGVRWGEDVSRRARFGLARVGAQGTWEAGVDRLLLGAAMADEDERFLGTALPLDDVDSNDVDLAGRLAELVDRLTVTLAALGAARTPDAWFSALDRALTLLGDVPPADAWQLVEARAVLGEVRQAAEGHASTLRLADVRALLGRRLRGRPTRSGFRTGALTICSLEPMRAVPHRVVCLLGMDDGAFPRGRGDDGDDVLGADPLVGERDPRAEDRQLFLDAVTSATEHLVVLYSGFDERTGAARPPAVPVAELLDAVDAAVAAPGGAPARDRLVVRHPLQTSDARNFAPGALGRDGAFSFDALRYRAAVRAQDPRTGPPAFLPAPLPPVDDGPDADRDGLDLDAVVDVLEHPVRGFVRRRLGVVLPGETDDLDDRIPLTLDPLQGWAVGDHLLAALLAGADPARAADAERRRGRIPPLALGSSVLEDVRGRVALVAEAAAGHLVGPAETLDARVPLPDGRTLTGTVVGVHGDAIVRAVFSRLGPKHRLRAWLQLLALVGGTPPGAAPVVTRAVTVGRAQ